MFSSASWSCIAVIDSGPFISNVVPFSGSFAVLSAVLVGAHGFGNCLRAFDCSSSSSSSDSESEMMPAGIATVSSDIASTPASSQKIANELNPGAIGKVATLSIPNLIRFVNPSPQNNSHPFTVVRLPQFSRFFLFEVCDCAQCCGLNSLTFPSGTYYKFGIRNVCVVPLSSSHSHRSVPIETLTVLDPANPFMVCVVGFNRPTKSDLMWDMHHEHRLSTPIHCVSVSNGVTLSDCFTFACIATAGKAIRS
jgi:hypothetical protein